MLEKKKVGVFKVQEIIRVPLTGLHFMNSKLVGGPLNLKKKNLPMHSNLHRV